MSQPEITLSRRTRAALWLFAAYVVLYAGFIFLAVFRPAALGEPVLLGVNLAIVYGVGLIVSALLLAIIYMLLCRRYVGDDPEEGTP